MSYAGILGDCKCECADPRCPAHSGKSDCRAKAFQILRRVDMLDLNGTAMCNDCADDAFDSGLFTSDTYGEDESEDSTEAESV